MPDDAAIEKAQLLQALGGVWPLAAAAAEEAVLCTHVGLDGSTGVCSCQAGHAWSVHTLLDSLPCAHHAEPRVWATQKRQLWCPPCICNTAGAEVQRLRPVSITHPEHPVNVARRRAAKVPGAVFADQFENLANLRAHLDTGARGGC
jgi:hypothetical protein